MHALWMSSCFTALFANVCLMFGLQLCSSWKNAPWVRMNVAISDITRSAWNNLMHHREGIWNAEHASNLWNSFFFALPSYPWINPITQSGSCVLVPGQSTCITIRATKGSKLPNIFTSRLYVCLHLSSAPGCSSMGMPSGLLLCMRIAGYEMRIPGTALSACASGRISSVMSAMCQPHRSYSLFPIFGKSLSKCPSSARLAAAVNQKIWTESRSSLVTMEKAWGKHMMDSLNAMILRHK